ncbi:cytochrome c biogenesis protein ResB [Cellulomonas fengjieae]|uniref:Cytochrome c biogenesis protein ResB n=1 Tax=Cellulomonas fengjieae TaxID=2819978 RepID=A0ABS3SDA4_9CELL|nr:cytochrome c biogenesis protein ResB [Cellulomonas fengjieae]MBO3083474.1 cytochrome c biogenesis protein ResB [Cellulomonas fengjieae]QVI65199.1 cytochrome c biogenesis protein ResB [Cellulomonas fengjieae]
MTTHRPEGLSDVFAEPTEAPAPTSTVPASLPALGFVGWLRWAWRQLTSMRVALLLLMLLAVAAVPGTVWPQRAQDAARVATYIAEHPTAGPWLDRLGFFDVYSSVWFSAIYILLFVSLVGCILPRTKVHLAGVRGRPPRAPRRFARFPAQGSGSVEASPERAAQDAVGVLRAGWRWLPFVPTYRVDARDEGGGTWSVSAERGYLRETGNLLFHLALVGLLISVATGQMLHYRGQAIVVQGRGFANAQVDYDTFEQGTAFSPESLVPFTLRLDEFESRFDPVTLQSRDFTAHVTLTNPGEDPVAETIKVNHPLTAGGAKVYLQGNGYAPELTVRDASGQVAFSGPTPFLPQDEVYTSRGVVKVPDVSGDQEQIGLVGYLLPTVDVRETAFGPAYASVHPQPDDPALVLAVWRGNLGLDTGVPQNVYELDESRMTQLMDADDSPVTLVVRPGETVDLPDGMGTLTFDGLPRYVALDLRHDPALPFVLVFALLAFAGLATSLFAPRRRLWLRFAPGTGGQDPRTVVTAAGLARGDDVGLQPELDRVLAQLATRTDDRPPVAPRGPTSGEGTP